MSQNFYSVTDPRNQNTPSEVAITTFDTMGIFAVPITKFVRQKIGKYLISRKY